MADETTRKQTQDLNFGPGVVITPGYDVPDALPKVTHSDRKIDHTGAIISPTEGEFGSTYGKGDSDAPNGEAPDPATTQAAKTDEDMSLTGRLSKAAPDRKAAAE